MTIYDQDFEVIQKELEPPDKRFPRFISWMNSLMKPLQWLHDLFFSDYADGSLAIIYSGISAYISGDRVRYGSQVFECILASTGNLPTNTTYWILILNDFRGARKRVKYNGQKLALEWILNEWFQANFVQPVFNPLSANSDFWIGELITDDGTFLVGLDGSTGPSIAPDLFSGQFIPLTYTGAILNFVVNYPLAVIPTTLDPKYFQMTSLVDQYKLYGTSVKYQGY